MYKVVVLTIIVGALAYALYLYATPLRKRSGPAMTFDGSGYATFGAGSEYDVRTTHFSFDLKTALPTGVLMYAKAADSDYFMISLDQGHVLVEFDMGSGSFPIRSQTVVSDGAWHSVSVRRNKKDVILVVDNENVAGTSPTANISISRPSVVYVGGTNIPEYVKFRGCMRHITFNDRYDIAYDFAQGGVTLGCAGQ